MVFFLLTKVEIKMPNRYTFKHNKIIKLIQHEISNKLICKSSPKIWEENSPKKKKNPLFNHVKTIIIFSEFYA